MAAHDLNCSMVMDEFYSSYIYTHDKSENGRTVSIAEYIEDVNTDNVVIIDGLTKVRGCLSTVRVADVRVELGWMCVLQAGSNSYSRGIPIVVSP